MKNPAIKLVLSSFCAFALAVGAHAGTVTDAFNSGVDFVASGVTNTIWDGVYLNSGDVPNGIYDGGAGPASTAIANETAFSGFLEVQDSSTYWNSQADDGFFLWKSVSGDFDGSVTVANPYQNGNYHMAGLLVRAFTTNGPAWGAPFSTTTTNAQSDNFLQITRFNEFSEGDIIRFITNGADVDQNNAGANGFAAPFNTGSTNYNTETNDVREMRITRTGDTFVFYDRTNDTDSWISEATNNRPDLHGIPMQVGIADSDFSGGPFTTFYENFSLSGPNVGAAVTPPADPTGLVAANISNSQTRFSWTPGAGSSGSVLVVRKNNALIGEEKPINGYTYNGNTNFALGDTLGGNIYVVYVGTGSSAIVTGLGNLFDVNYAAVYSYSGSGSSIVYDMAPSVTNLTGPAQVSSILLSLSLTNIPVDGVAAVTVVANYTDGSQTLNPVGATLASSNTAVATVASSVVNGLAVGTTAIIASYGGFNATNFVTVNLPAYTDNFSTPLNYLANGLVGSTWEGLYEKPGDLPNATYAGGPVRTTVFDADETTNGVLTLRAGNSFWAGTGDNGPFLFKYVPGDFQAIVHIHSISRDTNGNASVGYMFSGLMARAANGLATVTAPDGAPYGGSENWVYWGEFDQFGDTTEARYAVNGADNENPIFNGSVLSDYWLLMQRLQGTNFYFYRKVNATDPWEPHPEVTIVRPEFTNSVPLQVGLFQATYGGSAGTVQFDSFELDATNISGGVPPSAPYGMTMSYNATNNSMTLTWVSGTNANGTAATSFVVMREGAPVSAQPYFGILTSANSVFGQGSDLGGGNFLVFRGGALGTNSATVTGLTAGQLYYAAVYCYSGSSTTKSFNEAGASAASVQAGNFIGVTASLTGTIPVGGVGIPVVMGVLNSGGMVPVGGSTVIVSGNTNVTLGTNGVLTGLAVGFDTNTVMFASGTNVFTASLTATVVPPTFTDNFSVNHDYIVNGVTNTAWDGLFAYPTYLIPDSTYVSTASSSALSANANTTSNGVLTVVSENIGFEFGQNDGFFLFKYVQGDFQVAVHVTLDGGAVPSITYNNPGLLARLYRYDTGGNIGMPFGGTNGEAWVSWTRFDESGIGTYERNTFNNGTTRNPQPTQGDGYYWLLMVRQNATNFLFYQRQNPTDPWQPAPNGTTYSSVRYAGQPLEVGLLAGGFNNNVTVNDQFDTFMLNTVTTSPNVAASASAGTAKVTWTAIPGGTYTLLSSPSLTNPNWQPVLGGTPVFTNGVDVMTIPVASGPVFYRLEVP